MYTVYFLHFKMLRVIDYMSLRCQFKMQFLCENSPFKLGYLKTAFGGNVKAIFTDMKDSAKGSGQDFLTGRPVPVPDVSQLSLANTKQFFGVFFC